ncbi:hypothetical protein Hanom_Chr02g00112681 [Helianthus anomalus]
MQLPAPTGSQFHSWCKLREMEKPYAERDCCPKLALLACCKEEWRCCEMDNGRQEAGTPATTSGTSRDAHGLLSPQTKPVDLTTSRYNLQLLGQKRSKIHQVTLHTSKLPFLQIYLIF